MAVTAGSTAVHCLHCGLCSYCREARCVFTRVLRRHTVIVSSLSSCRHGVSCCPTVTLHCWGKPLDVSKPTQDQHGQDGVPVGRFETQPFKPRLLSSDFTTRLRLQCSPHHVRLLGVILSSNLSLVRRLNHQHSARHASTGYASLLLLSVP